MPKELPKKPKLNARQARFVEEYLVDGNGTRAAIRAGYSPASAAVQASDLLRNPKVAAALESARSAQSERTQITADRVLEELWRVASSDLAKAFDKEGRLLSVHEMPAEARAALAGVDTEELFEGKGEERTQVGVSRKVRNWDKVKALELVGKHLGMFRERLEHSGPDGAPLTVEIVRYDGKGGG